MASTPVPFVQDDTDAPAGPPAAAAGEPASAGAPPAPQVDASDPNALGGTSTAPAAAPASAPPVQQGIRAEQATGGPNWGARALHGILNGLGGTNTITYTPGPDGKLQATQQAKGPGQQWKTIIAGFLTGVGASGQAGSGPGQLGRAAALGASAGAERAIASDQQARQRGQQDFQDQQQAAETAMKQRANNAQVSLMGQQTMAASFELARRHVDATNADIDRENVFSKIVQSTPGARDLGVIAMDPDKGDGDPREALSRFVKGDPTLIKEFAAGNIQMVSAIRDGKVVGVHAALVPQQWGEQKTAQDITLHTFAKPDKPGDPPKEIAYTIPANSITNAEALTYTMQNSKESAGFYNNQFDQAQETRRTAMNDRKDLQVAGIQANAEVQRGMIAAGMGLPGQDAGGVDGAGNTVDQAAELLVAGKEAPSMLNNRSGMKQAVINRAATLAKQRGVQWDPETAEENYKANVRAVQDVTSGKTRDQIGSFNTFLGHAAAASDDIDKLRNGNLSLVNTARNKLRMATNDPLAQVIASFDVDRNAAVSEYSNFIKNGHAATKADEDALATIADQNQPLSVQQAAMKALAHTGAIRLGSINAGWQRGPGRAYGNNPAQNVQDLLTVDGAKALQRFGIDPRSVYAQGTEAYNPTAQLSTTPPQAVQAAQAAPTPPPGATQNVLVNGVVTGHIVNGKYVPLPTQAGK